MILSLLPRCLVLVVLLDLPLDLVQVVEAQGVVCLPLFHATLSCEEVPKFSSQCEGGEPPPPGKETTVKRASLVLAPLAIVASLREAREQRDNWAEGRAPGEEARRWLVLLHPSCTTERRSRVRSRCDPHQVTTGGVCGSKPIELRATHGPSGRIQGRPLSRRIPEAKVKASPKLLPAVAGGAELTGHLPAFIGRRVSWHRQRLLCTRLSHGRSHV